MVPEEIDVPRMQCQPGPEADCIRQPEESCTGKRPRTGGQSGATSRQSEERLLGKGMLLTPFCRRCVGRPRIGRRIAAVDVLLVPFCRRCVSRPWIGR
jgi:hypothetical protein